MNDFLLIGLWEVTGCCFRDLNHQRSGSGQSGLLFLCSAYSDYPPPGLGEVSVLAELLRDRHRSVARLCDPMDCSTPGLPVHHQLPELTQTHVHRVGDAIQPSHPLPPIPPSIRVFSNESVLHIRWPKVWSFSFSISPSNEHPGLVSFRMDWLDLLAVQGTLKSLLQHHSSKHQYASDCYVLFLRRNVGLFHHCTVVFLFLL